MLGKESSFLKRSSCLIFQMNLDGAGLRKRKDRFRRRRLMGRHKKLAVLPNWGSARAIVDPYHLWLLAHTVRQIPVFRE